MNCFPRSLRQTCVLAAVILGGANGWGTQSFVIELGDPTAKPFSGWGVHPCDSDPVKESVERFPDAVGLFQALKLDFVKCIAKPECWDSKGDGLNAGFIDHSLVAQLRLMRSGNISRYLLAIEAPPKAYRQYYSNEGLVDMHLNGLLRSEEANYSRLLVSLIRYLVKQGVGAPEALIIQSSVNLRIQYGACVLPPDQLRRLSVAVRSELDADPELSGVHIAGPDALGYSASLDYLRPSAPDSVDHSATPFDSLVLQSNSPREDVSEVLKLLSPAPSGGQELWVSGWYPHQTSSEADGVMQAIEQLSFDFNRGGVTRWFWGQAYFHERTARGLIFGTGKRTGLYPLFSELTKRIKPGAHLLRFKLNSALPDGVGPPIMAFLDPDDITVVVGNVTADNLEISLVTKRPTTHPMDFDVLPPGNLDWVRSTIDHLSDKVSIPPRSVCVLRVHR